MHGEENFEQMWRDAQDRFQKKTKISLKQAKNRSLDDVLAELNDHFTPQDSEDASKKARIKKLATNVLNFVQLLGGIAASGASMVFGPANLCFNALSFLMNIPSKISGFYDNIMALFNEISTFMKQFKIYKRVEQYADVGMELKEDTHKIMIAFVDICAISIRTLGGSHFHTFTTMAKLVLFNDESEIPAKLREFRALIEHQGQISNAVTLEHVLKAEHDTSNSFSQIFARLNESAEQNRRELQNMQRIDDNVSDIKLGTDMVVEDVNERRNEKKQKDRMKSICEKLSVAPGYAMPGDSLVKAENISGTGSWLDNIGVFSKWADLDSDFSQLVLSGNSGSGKSHLVSFILDRLDNRSDASSGDLKRVSSASYGFSKIRKEPQNAVKESLKFVAVRLARIDSIYQDQILFPFVDANSTRLKDMSISELFKGYFVPSSANVSSKFVCLLVFEDLDQLNQDDARSLFNVAFQQSTTGLRIVLTGTDDIFRSCRDSYGKSIDPFPWIKVQEHNEPDIKSFIEQELHSQQLLPTNIAGALRIIDEIRKRLPSVANGNFYNVVQIIEIINSDIGSGMSEDEIIKLISVDSLKHKTDITRQLMEELNRILNVQEIEQLNILLAWVLYGFEYFSINKLVAALFLQTKKPLLQDINIKIGRKYDKILKIDGKRVEDQVVKIKSEDLVEYFNESKRERPFKIEAEGDKQPRISMTIKLDHVSVSQAQRFFWDLSEKVVFDKFIFTTAAATSEPTSQVSANKVDSHILIVKSCLEVLLDECGEETSALGSYAILNLHSHLEELSKERDEMEVSERAEIVDSLIDLLQDPTPLEKHLNEEFLEGAVGLHDGLDIIQAWLRDSEAKQILNRKQQGWLRKAHASDKLFPMTKMAVMIARQWLCNRLFALPSPYIWLNVFVLRESQLQSELQSQNQNTTSVGSGQSEVGPPEPSRREYTDADYLNEEETAYTGIDRAAKWALATAAVDEDSLYYERLGMTYLFYGKTDLAIETLLKAKRLPNSSWQSSQCLANAYARKDEIRLALEEIETTFPSRRSDHDLSLSGKAELIDDLIKAAEWCIKSGNVPDAVVKLEEAIRLDEHFYKSYYELFKILHDAKQWSEAMCVLLDMEKEPAAAHHEDLSKLSSMLLEYPRWIGEIETLENVLQATKSHEVFDTILSALQKALDFAVDKSMDTHIVNLYLGHGLALSRTNKAKDYAYSALEQWENCFQIGIKSEDWESQRKAIGAATFIFNHHFSLAHTALELSNVDKDEYKFSVEKMKDIAEGARFAEYEYRPLKASLASFYATEGNQVETRELLMDDLRESIDHLSIADPDHAFFAYEEIANLLMHAGDDLDALSAWFLYYTGYRDYNEQKKPNEDANGHEEAKENIENTATLTPEPAQALGDIPFLCDGRCKKNFTYADSLWSCKVCNNIGFCDECLGKLQNGTLPWYVCSADHPMLLVPSWLDELKATGKGRVRIGGELRDGKREGGDFVTVDEWLDTVRERWNLPAANKNEQKQDDNATTTR